MNAVVNQLRHIGGRPNNIHIVGGLVSLLLPGEGPLLTKVAIQLGHIRTEARP